MVPHQSVSGLEPSGATYQPASNHRKSTFTSSAIIFSSEGRQVDAHSEMLPSELGRPVSLARQQVLKGSIARPDASQRGRLHSTNQRRQ